MDERNPPSNDGEIDISKLWKNILREKLLIIFITVFSTSSSILYTYLVEPIYSGSFNIVVKKNSKSNAQNLIGNELLLDLITPSNSENRTQELILSSPSVIKPVFEYVNSYYKKNNIEKEYNNFEEWLDVLEVKFQNKSQILKVTYKDNDKKLILQSLKLISEKYQDYSKRDREKSIVKTIKYLEEQKEIMEKQSTISQSNLNKFSIENGLGSIDGFVELGESSTNIRDLMNLKNMSNNMGQLPIKKLELDSTPRSNAGQRFTLQYNLLENYETEYIDLSSKLKPNSKTLTKLKTKIENLRSSLKRPNEILIEYNELRKKATRDSSLLKQIEDDMEVVKLEQIKSPDPWELISEPIIDLGRVFPNRKLIAIISFFSSLIVSIALALFKQKRSGLIYELDDLKRIINLKFLDKIYLNNTELSIEIINKVINVSNSNDNRINNNDVTGLSLFNNSQDETFIESIIQKNNSTKKSDITNINSKDKMNKIILIINSGIKLKDLELLNKYIFINEENLIGWFFIDRDTNF